MGSDLNYSFSTLIAEIGEVGIQMTDLGAAEGSAGNISAFVKELDEPDSRFLPRKMYSLPVAVPALAGGWLIVSGTGRRLRDIARTPESNLCLLKIQPGGQMAILYAGIPLNPTSELVSHLAIHHDFVGRHGAAFHAIVHAQPRYLTYLSHLPAYYETADLNRRLMRWEPETLIVFPEGIGMIPFEVPGTTELMALTVEGLRRHRAVVWQRHGIVTRSEESVHNAGDLVEYAETAAHYEILNLLNSHPVDGLSNEELQRVADHFGIKLRI